MSPRAKREHAEPGYTFPDLRLVGPVSPDGAKRGVHIPGLDLPDRRAHNALLAAENIALVGPPPLLDTADRNDDLNAGRNPGWWC
jgi:hypothetical protein